MSKDQEIDLSTTAASNTDFGGVGIGEGMPPSDVNNAMRYLAKMRADAVTRHVAKGAGSHTALKTDHNQFWRCTGAVTINLTAAATLISGWCLWVRANGGAVTIDPSGAETIDGAATITLADGQAARMLCTGTAFFTVMAGVGGGAGAVLGPASATDNAIARFDGTTGKMIQNSGATIDDSGNLSAVAGTFTGAFTSLGIDDNATGERLQISNTTLTIGGTGAYTIELAVDDNLLEIGGGTGANAAALGLYGGTTGGGLAGDYAFVSGGTVYYYDATANKHSMTGTVYISGTTRIGQDTTDVPGVGNNTTGASIDSGGRPCFSYATTAFFNRTASGNLLSWDVGGTTQGTISEAAGTITYGTFFGAHWSQLADGSRQDILPGTIVETIPEMCAWPAAEWTDHDGVVHRDEEVAAGRAIGEVFEHTYQRVVERVAEDEIEVQETEEVEVDTVEVRDGQARLAKGKCRQPLFDELPLHGHNGELMVDAGRNKATVRLVHVPRMRKEKRKRIVGETITERVSAKVVLPAENRLPRFRISDTPGSKAVYGVFHAWDEKDTVSNDAYIGSLGAYVIRIDAGQNVQIGDYVESAGNGCGRVQRDDVLRAGTVAKVTSTAIVETYPDGSYLVPCTLHCG